MCRLRSELQENSLADNKSSICILHTVPRIRRGKYLVSELASMCYSLRCIHRVHLAGGACVGRRVGMKEGADVNVNVADVGCKRLPRWSTSLGICLFPSLSRVASNEGAIPVQNKRDCNNFEEKLIATR